jgi:hypothetical protein
MKTLNIKSYGSAMTTLLFTALFALSSCGSNPDSGTSQQEASSSSKKEVKAPGMDIHSATVIGDLDVIQQHILAGTDLDAREPSMGSSALISAAVFGRTEIARALIEAGADVNLQNNEGSSALHSAAFLCRKEIVEMLLEHGADTSLKNIYGSTPLQSVIPSFADVKPIYDQFSKDLGPLGFKLDYEYVESTRPIIADMLR